MKKKLFLFSYSLLSDYVQRVQTGNPVKYSIKISSIEIPTSVKGIRDKNYKIGRLIKNDIVNSNQSRLFYIK